MSSYDIYVFLLCLIVYVLLASLSIIVSVALIKMTLKMIKHGLEDEKIKEEQKNKKKKCTLFDKILSNTAGVLFVLAFIFATYVNIQDNTVFENIPTLKVVQSASMATKNEKNTYLQTNGLNDQFQTFDLILTYKLPKEEDLQLYDIVVYEVDDMLVVHRIVGIEEPNANHSERYFLLQGDAVERPDRFPVYYSQMKAIYRGERIPFVGSFILFLQSPAGWLCVILLLFTLIALPIIEKKLDKATSDRYKIINELELQEAYDAIKKRDIEKRRFETLKENAKNLTFKQKLKKCEVANLRLQLLKPHFDAIEGVRVIESKNSFTYKKGNKPIAKFAIVGKTLNAYFALQPAEFENTKYKFIDVSNKAKFKNYPMRVKITSDRQSKWATELVKIASDKLTAPKGEGNAE